MNFFEKVLPASHGWTPLIMIGPKGGLTDFTWFTWPEQLPDMMAFISKNSHRDVYFSPFLYKQPPGLHNTRHATKANVIAASCVWSDGDSMDFAKLRVEPSVYVQSSEGHWQAYWTFTDADLYSVTDFEDLSRGLYNEHATDGMDRGWPLAKKMRVPGTTNTKYKKPFSITWRESEDELTVGEFAAEYPPAEVIRENADIPDLPVDVMSPFDVISKVQRSFITDLFLEEADESSDRSAMLYHLECALWEEGCTNEEVYAVARATSYNKFKQDGRGDEGLWHQLHNDRKRWEQENAYREIAVANTESQGFIASDYVANAQGMEWNHLSFLHDDEQEPTDTFVDAFVFWASQRSKQSPKQFHVCGALALLSQMFARYAYIPLSFGKVPLNLYFLVLGRTTQSRKSTSLRLAQRVTKAVVGVRDLEEYVVPDDATAEALASFLSQRPNKSSIYSIDEVQDLFQQASKRNGYLSNMIGFLTKAFDGQVPGQIRKTGETKYQKSVPHYMTFYGTGILSVSAKYLTTEKIETGFVPRCLVAVDDKSEFTLGSDDLEYINSEEEERRLIDTGEKALASLVIRRNEEFEQRFLDRAEYLIAGEDARFPVPCDMDAFDRWKQFAREATEHAANHQTCARELFPMVERMTNSTLKIAALLCLVEGDRSITMRHMLKAISLASIWMPSSEVFVKEVSNTGFARLVDDIITYIASQQGAKATYARVLSKFQGSINSGRELSEAVTFAQRRGMIEERLHNTNNGQKPQRMLHFTGRKTE